MFDNYTHDSIKREYILMQKQKKYDIIYKYSFLEGRLLNEKI